MWLASVVLWCRIPQLQLASQAHGCGQGVRVVNLNVEAERRLETHDEELDTLGLREHSRTL